MSAATAPASDRHRALFLDRDGVINLDHGYVHAPEHFTLVPGVLDVLRRAQDLGYLLIIVTNQAGIARGFYDEATFIAFDAWMQGQLRIAGVTIARTYYAPCHPEGTVPLYRCESDCRKPGPGMLQQAARDYQIDLAASLLIGDRLSDLEAARRAGIGRALLLRLHDAAPTLPPEAVGAGASAVSCMAEAEQWLLQGRR